jgi:hypothetical protein
MLPANPYVTEFGLVYREFGCGGHNYFVRDREGLPNVVELLHYHGDGGYDILLVHQEPGHVVVTWLVLEWAGGPVQCSDPSDPDNGLIYYTVPMHGSGCGEGLRECRHVYFGDDDDGYWFYPNPELIAWVFEKLGRWFDY